MSTKYDKYRSAREEMICASKYARAVTDSSNAFVYSFLPRFGYTTDLKDALRDVGIYYGANGISVPMEFTNELFLTGVKVGKRKAIINKSKGKEILDSGDTNNVSLKQLIEKRINYTKDFINSHSDKFTRNETDLINI